MGCGCGGLILLALLFFSVVRYVNKHGEDYRVDTDTTQVSTESGSDESSGTDTSTGKPADKPTDDASPSDDEEGLKEIRPVTGDSTF